MTGDSIGVHHVWDVKSVDLPDQFRQLNGMAESLAVRHLKSSMSALSTGCSAIEIGSGLGKMGLFSGMLGAKVTLLDSSSDVLEVAQQLYAAVGVPVDVRTGNALSLPDALHEHFDLSISLGLNEHFSGPARQSIFDAHFSVLRPGGKTLIAVPNRHCFSYRLAMLMWKLTGRWPEDLYEYGFSYRELRGRMHDAGFEDVQVFSGSYPAEDFRHFVLGNLRAALRKFGLMSAGKAPTQRAEVSPETIRAKLQSLPSPALFRHWQSYTWIAMGVRR
jgi:2-polyprenyl-3-methyl-5-hydroxy-6-metoxy-1,4-benzoquinol methylase